MLAKHLYGLYKNMFTVQAKDMCASNMEVTFTRWGLIPLPPVCVYVCVHIYSNIYANITTAYHHLFMSMPPCHSNVSQSFSYGMK
jgi:hypothetical protein